MDADGNPHGKETSSTDCVIVGPRIKITNFSPFAGAVQMKKFVQGTLNGLPFRKFKYAGRSVFISLESERDADEAIRLLNNAHFKKNVISAVKAKELCLTGRQNVVSHLLDEAVSTNEVVDPSKRCKQLVTPLANVPYETQLAIKFEHSKELVNLLGKQLTQANASNAISRDGVLSKVLPSPIVEGYRNKCEFSIGYSPDSDHLPVVGFVSGKMANKQCQVVPIDDCSNITSNTRAIVLSFEAFVREFGERPFNEFERTGFWKMLTIKDFLGDTMIIVTVYPHQDQQVSEKAKTTIKQRFLPANDFGQTPFHFNVTSLFWQEQVNSGDERKYEHLAGSPYVYESLLGMNFRISPSTFFQVNTRATEVLYSKIGDLLNLPKTSLILPDDEYDEEIVNNKRIKLDESESATVILDICCGAGTISLCLMQRLRRIQKADTNAQRPFGCVGVELNTDAVRDARKNASENGFDPKSCIYIDGEAEQIFKELEYHMPSGCTLNSSRILGIIDPPRAGVSDKVIIGCRKLQQLQTLCFLSCDPKAAMKNIVDLCRPTSRKFEGSPFRITRIHPVDLFPQTEHVEFIYLLQR